jgi:hypothetical protein
MFAEIQFIFQFKVPPQAPYKNVVFNHEIFKETNKENVLTRAILKQFGHSQTARDAAWDYIVQYSKKIIRHTDSAERC